MRNPIDEVIGILIKTAPYKSDPLWSEIKSVEGQLKPGDIVRNFKWVEQPVLKFWEEQNPNDTEYALFMYIIRPRLETDDEYVARLKQEEAINAQKEKNDYETYLRLKAKYEK